MSRRLNREGSYGAYAPIVSLFSDPPGFSQLRNADKEIYFFVISTDTFVSSFGFTDAFRVVSPNVSCQNFSS